MENLDLPTVQGLMDEPTPEDQRKPVLIITTS